jgi:hypothetical protein
LAKGFVGSCRLLLFGVIREIRLPTRSWEMFPGRFKKLKILAPDPYDLVLSKLERNSPKDQGDVEYLAKTARLDPKVLRDRYQKKLRSNLMARKSWHNGTLAMWLGSYFSTHE